MVCFPIELKGKIGGLDDDMDRLLLLLISAAVFLAVAISFALTLLLWSLIAKPRKASSGLRFSSNTCQAHAKNIAFARLLLRVDEYNNTVVSSLRAFASNWFSRVLNRCNCPRLRGPKSKKKFQ